MKRIMIIAISIIAIAAVVVCYFFCSNPSSTACCQPAGAQTTDAAACNKCGKTSCDKSCSTNPEDSTYLKSLVPSCNLSGSEMVDRKNFLQGTIATKINNVVEMETGYDIVFHQPKEFSQELLEFVNFERNCCSNFTYALIFEPNNAATHLQMYGSTEIKEELKRGFIEAGFLKQ